MKNKNIKVIDEHNIDRDANVMFALELEGSEYVVYWISRDEESNNVFVSKVLKNMDGTNSMLNIEDEEKKKEIAEIVKTLVSSAVADQNDKMPGVTMSLSNGKIVKFVNVAFNKEQQINVTKTYITTVKKEVTKVAETYYDVVAEEQKIETILTAAPVVETVPEVFPEIVAQAPVAAVVEPITVMEPAVAPITIGVETPVVVTPQPVVSTPVVEAVPTAPAPVMTPVAETPAVVTPQPVVSTPVVEAVSIAPAPVMTTVVETPVVVAPQPVVSTPVVEAVSVAAVPVVGNTVVETPVVAAPQPVVSTPVVDNVPVAAAPVVGTPATQSDQLIFNASKEINLNAALGEVASSAIIPVEDINSVREFGVETPVGVAPQPVIAPMIQPEVSEMPKTLTRKAGFANSKFFMVIAISFFLASCIFLGYEVFNYFQLVK